MLTLGWPTCSIRLYSSCNCFFPPTSLRSPSPWVRRGPGSEESHTESHQADAYCFYQGLSRACSTDRALQKPHEQNAAAPHVTGAGLSPRAVQTHQATRPITQALRIRRWRPDHNRQPWNALRQPMSASWPQDEGHWHNLYDRSLHITTVCWFLIFFGIVFLYKGKTKSLFAGPPTFSLENAEWTNKTKLPM